MENNKSKNKVVSIICGILTVLGIVAIVISLIQGSNNITMINNGIDLVLSVLILYYAIHGYKKPHGNLLKYIILIFAVPFIISVYSRAMKGDAIEAVIRTITIGLLCYIAGRLHKVKENIVLMIIVTSVFVFFKIRKMISGFGSISTFTSLIIWADICVAYFMRYKEHKEVGLMDAEKK